MATFLRVTDIPLCVPACVLASLLYIYKKRPKPPCPSAMAPFGLTTPAWTTLFPKQYDQPQSHIGVMGQSRQRFHNNLRPNGQNNFDMATRRFLSRFGVWHHADVKCRVHNRKLQRTAQTKLKCASFPNLPISLAQQPPYPSTTTWVHRICLVLTHLKQW